MSDQDNSSNKNGIGFTGLLTILFIGLKLTGIIDWPWLWVLAPMWIGVLLWLIAAILIAIIVIAKKI